MGSAQRDPDNKERKFFFDMHNFDDPNAGPDAAPPPPVYAQDDLDAAKTLAQEQGRQKGLNEAQASREQKVAQLVQQISTQFATLFAAEQERESRYEEDVIALVLQTLDKLFPAFNERIGPHEAQQAIARVLKTAADQSDITIRIHPDFTAEIEAIVAPIRDKDINPPSFHIIGDETLGPGDCRLQWRDGGAVRDTGHLSNAVRDALIALLPPGNPLVSGQADNSAQGTDAINDDINEEIEAESPQSDPAPQDSGETHE